MPTTDVINMKVADLKRELKLRGLSAAGNKNELQERLQAAMEGEPLLEDSSLVGEDILDEEVVLSDEEKILGADENDLLKSPTNSLTATLPKKFVSDSKNTVAIEDDILETSTAITKKIVLNRKSSLNSLTSIDSSGNMIKENNEPTQAKVKMSERNPIIMGEDQAGASAAKKLKELSMQERLELRAKKFGIEPKPAAEIIVAKEKNGVISVAPAISNEKQVELLKKRAERFGCVTSTNLAKLDAEERLLKRKQRFGGEPAVGTKVKLSENDTVTTKTSSDGSTDEWTEKARKRLERFRGNGNNTIGATANTNHAANRA